MALYIVVTRDQSGRINVQRQYGTPGATWHHNVVDAIQVNDHRLRDMPLAGVRDLWEAGRISRGGMISEVHATGASNALLTPVPDHWMRMLGSVYAALDRMESRLGEIEADHHAAFARMSVALSQAQTDLVEARNALEKLGRQAPHQESQIGGSIQAMVQRREQGLEG